MMLKFSLLENDSERLHSIGMHYQSLVEVPQEFLEAPTPIIIKEAKRIELRLMIEACLVALAGVIPSSLIAVVFG
jgi:hypothetical protein